MRVVSTMKNSAWGVLQQCVMFLLNFTVRKIMFVTIGLEGVSLSGLFSNILELLSMAELGVGAAIIYHLYEPIAHGNKEEICRLMNFYKLAYRLIALVIGVVGIAIIPLLPYIVKGLDSSKGYSSEYVMLVYVLFIIQTVSTYFFAYKRSLLMANQQQYKVVGIDIGFKALMVAVNSAILIITKDFIAYLISLTILGVLNNWVVAKKVDKMYPYIIGKLKLEKEKRAVIYKNVKDIFIGKISGSILTSTDSILISAVVGTLQVGRYSNYSIIISAVLVIINQIANAMSGSIGNLVVTERKEYISKVLKRLNFGLFMIGSFCSVSLFCLCDPFILIVFGEYTLPITIVSVAVFNFFLQTIRIPTWKMLNVSGLFAKDKYISMTGMITNLIVSLIFGMKYGMVGILLGTTAAMVVEFICKIILFYKDFLHTKYASVYMRLVIYSVVFVAEAAGTLFLCNIVGLSNQFADFAVRVIMCLLIPNVVNILVFGRTDEFKYFKKLGFKMLKRG